MKGKAFLVKLVLSRFLFAALKLFVVLFPVVTGVFLTNLGTAKLNEASIISAGQRNVPYGFLAFSSTPLRSVESHIYLDYEYETFKKDDARCFIFFRFEPNETASGEQIFGFQLPGIADISKSKAYPENGFSIRGFTDHEETPINIIDEKAVTLTESGTSIIYIRFIALQGLSRYEGGANCALKGLTGREGFSTYKIAFPVAKTKETVHKSIYDYFPEVYAYLGSDLGLRIGISLPEGSEIRRTQPPPSGEEVMVGEKSRNRLMWMSRPEFRTEQYPHPASEYVTVDVEFRSESEYRNRLFFDSGLYMGLGISLILGGIHEALKVASELRKKKI